MSTTTHRGERSGRRVLLGQVSDDKVEGYLAVGEEVHDLSEMQLV